MGPASGSGLESWPEPLAGLGRDRLCPALFRDPG